MYGNENWTREITISNPQNIRTVFMLKIGVCSYSGAEEETDVDSRNQRRFYSAPPTAKI